MQKLTIENIKTLEFKTTVDIWCLIPEFIIELSSSLGLNNSDVLELFALNTEKDPKKIQINELVEYYAFLSDVDKENIKTTENFKDIDFDIDSLSNDFLEKHKRLSNLSSNFLGFIQSINKESNVYQKAINILSLATNQPKDVLNNTNLIVLIELLYELFHKIYEETVKGFFFMKKAHNLSTNIYLLNFIKTVKKSIQIKQ